MKAEAYGIILAGGNGERFWPMSTPDRPKQFVDFFEHKALIRHAADRLEGLIPPERILVITAKRFVRLTRQVLPHIPKGNIVGEPCRRDTAAAVALAVGLVKKLGGADAVGCILTADHLMSPEADFRKTLKRAVETAEATEDIVTIGITPTRPETGYGYIDPKAKIFVEKPDLKTAKRYLKSGRYLWNSGMFIWRASTMEAAFAAHAPDFLPLIKKPSTKDYDKLRSISVDFAVMEKVRNLSVIRGDFKWNDVGNWCSLPAILAQDARGNTRLGAVTLADTSDSIVVSNVSKPLMVIGLENVVVVQTSHGTLVCAADKVQDIKKVLKDV